MPRDLQTLRNMASEGDEAEFDKYYSELSSVVDSKLLLEEAKKAQQASEDAVRYQREALGRQKYQYEEVQAELQKTNQAKFAIENVSFATNNISSSRRILHKYWPRKPTLCLHKRPKPCASWRSNLNWVMFPWTSSLYNTKSLSRNNKKSSSRRRLCYKPNWIGI